MKRNFLFIAVTFLSISVMAQKPMDMKTKMDDSKMTKNGWTRGFNMYVGLTQVGNDNWYTTGSDKFNMAVFGELSAYATKKWKNKQFANTFDAAYGLFNTSSAGVTKLNDRLEASTRYLITPKNWKKWSVGPLAALRTQFTDGYFYNYMGDQGVKRRRSGFFAPAFITAAPIGIEWKPTKWFDIYASPLTVRWTVVSNGAYSYASQGGIYKGTIENSLAGLYNVNPAKENKGEFGLYASAGVNKEIMKNIWFKTRIEVFGNYLKPATENADNIGVAPFDYSKESRFVNFDMFMTNQLNFRVNKWIKVTYNLDLLYDDDMKQPYQNQFVTPHAVGLQVLSTLGVGFTAKF